MCGCGSVLTGSDLWWGISLWLQLRSIAIQHLQQFLIKTNNTQHVYMFCACVCLYMFSVCVCVCVCMCVCVCQCSHSTYLLSWHTQSPTHHPCSYSPSILQRKKPTKKLKKSSEIYFLLEASLSGSGCFLRFCLNSMCPLSSSSSRILRTLNLTYTLREVTSWCSRYCCRNALA